MLETQSWWVSPPPPGHHDDAAASQARERVSRCAPLLCAHRRPGRAVADLVAHNQVDHRQRRLLDGRVLVHAQKVKDHLVPVDRLRRGLGEDLEHVRQCLQRLQCPVQHDRPGLNRRLRLWHVDGRQQRAALNDAPGECRAREGGGDRSMRWRLGTPRLRTSGVMFL